MIQRLIGVSLGGIATFAVLWFSDFTNQTDLIPWYVTASVLGAVVSFFWPVIMGWRAASRIRERREEEIQREVERQVAEQTKGQ